MIKKSIHDKNFIEKAKMKIEQSKSDPEFTDKVNRSLREVLSEDDVLNHSISFFENDEYRFCHPDEVKDIADEAKAILKKNGKWSETYDNKYNYILSLHYRFIGDDND